MYHITGTDALMFKKDYLIRIGCFPHIDLGDEFYLMQSAIDAKGKFGYLNRCDVKAYVHTGKESLSSGNNKIRCENQLYVYKKEFFSKLDKKTIKYIRMRHYAVIAFAYYRMKSYGAFIANALHAALISPYYCIKMYINMAK